MRITKYRTELDQDFHCVLVKEKSCNYYADQLHTPDAIVNMLNDLFRLEYQSEEFLYMVAFNKKMRPLGVFEVSHGTVDCSLCTPREIFIKAMLCGACSIVIAHNHPSMDTSPSGEDIDVYKRLKESGNIIGIPLIDSLIVGKGFYSFHESWES